jgi:predicted N-acetyltransferase YhbS
MRFLPQMLDVAAELTTLGVIVLAPFKVIPTGEQTGVAKARLDALHRRKIALSHRVVVVSDPSYYVGESTRSEIAYAARIGRPVTWAIGGVR